MNALERIAAALREEGGLLADALADDLGTQPTPLGDVAQGELGYVIEAVNEGWRLHAEDPEHPPRVVLTDDPDLALLAGDRLYALGLARLAELGDLQSVAVLTDVIATTARARVEGRPEVARRAFAEAAKTLHKSHVRS